MDNAAPALEVGFQIVTGGSLGEIEQLQRAVGEAEGQIVRQAGNVEKTLGGMVKLGPAVAEIRAFGGEASRSYAAAEKAAERMIFVLEREATTFGKTRSEIRDMRAEQKALAADSVGLTEVAARLRAANAEMQRLEAAANGVTRGVKGSTGALAAMAPQAQDLFTQISMGGNILNAFVIQAGQASSQMIHMGGAAGKFAAFMMGPWGLALTAGALVVGALADKLLDNSEAAKKAEEGMRKFQDRQSDIGNFIDATTGRLTEQNRVLVLNATLTRQAEIAANNKLIRDARKDAFRIAGNVQAANAPIVATGTSGVSVTQRLTDPAVQAAIKAANGDVGKLIDSVSQLAKTRPNLAPLVRELSTVAGGAVLASRENNELRKELRALAGDTTALGRGTASAIEKQVALATATTPLAKARAELDLVRQGASAAEKEGGAALKRYEVDLTRATVAVNKAEAAEKAATAARREAGRETRHAEKLATEAEAIEAQITGLYRLADAYGLVGGASLIAEARVKGETDAIRKRGEAEAFANRQLRLAVAERVRTGEQSAASMRDQAMIQRQVNAEVAAGTIPAQLAADLVRDRLADLPLLVAAEAARTAGDIAGAERAAAALDKQRAAREDLTAAQRDGRFQGLQSSGDEQLAYMREELRLVGATEIVRARSLAIFKADQDARALGKGGAEAKAYVAQQGQIAEQGVINARATREWNDGLRENADLWGVIAATANEAARGMSDAFGEVGRSIGDAASIMTGYYADQARLQTDFDQRTRDMATGSAALAREQRLFAIQSASLQIGAYGDMASAAKGFFKEGSSGYKALAAAEKVFRAVELGMAVKNAAVQLGLIGGVTAARTVATGTAIAGDAAFTATSIANSGIRAAADGTAAMAKTAASAPFPLNLAGMAVMAAALASIGVATGFLGGGGKNTLAKANDGTGTVLGDADAKSESLKRSIDALRDIDTLMLSSSREMASTLRSIDSQIGGVAALVVRAGNVNASGDVAEGFKASTVGSILSKIPVIGGFLGGLFGTKTTVVGSGLSAGPQTLDSILNSGFDASYYSDVQKKKKLFGITTSTKYSTSYTGADAGLENQFTLILRDFASAIGAAAGPLGESTAEIERRLGGFVVNLGKIDLQGLSGEEIEEKLSAVFGAAADQMALAALPGFERFQKVGEGAFETLVRVASTVEAVTASLDMLGGAARTLGIDAKLGLAGQFDSVSDFNSAAEAYFTAYYSAAEQNAAKVSQLSGVFVSLGVAMPDTLAGFRALVEAQDLTTAAGQSTYATLLQLAPAFADLKGSMEGAKSAADILAERQDLQRKLLELNGDTAAIRALDLAKVDASNRALQEQVWAIEDAQKAAAEAERLSEAWASVGNSIEDEIRRIRGLSDASGGVSFASAMSQFNAATIAARGGDQDAAKLLPSLSQALLKSAADAATSRQELDRVQAQTAASLEATSTVIAALAKRNPLTSAGIVAAAGAAAQAASPASTSASDTADPIRLLRDEIAALRAENNAGHARTASEAGRSGKVLERAAGAAGGDVIGTRAVA